METSNKSIGRWWNDLPLFAEGIHASLSVTQVVAKVKKILATCGLGYDKPLANYDPNTQFWKMSEGIFPLGEQPSLPILPPSGMTRNGALFQQPAWVPITDATASSSWPTPTAVTRPMEGNVRLYRAMIEAGEMTDAEAEAILGKSVWEAQGKLPAKWPTPTARDWKGPSGRAFKGESMDLPQAVRMWPTPIAGTANNYVVKERSSPHGNLNEELAKSDPSAVGGKLNPMWVEWLMGFPTGWTDLKD